LKNFGLKLENITKKYDKNIVLENIGLQIDNPLTIVKGINGSGKTTLLRMIAGIEHISKGDIIIGHYSIKKDPVGYRRLVNFSEAEPVYPGTVTGRELLQYYIRSKKGSKKESSKMIRMFEMESYIDYTIETYSTGMKKKLSLLLSFIGQKYFVLLDEPFTSIDEDGFKNLQELIKEYVKNGSCFIISSCVNDKRFTKIYRRLKTLIIKDNNIFPEGS